MDPRELADFQKAIGQAFDKSLQTFARQYGGLGVSRRESRDQRETKDPSEDRRKSAQRDEGTSTQSKKNARIAKNIGDAQQELFLATSELTALTNKQIKSTKKGQSALERVNDALEESSKMLANSLEESARAANRLVNEPIREMYDTFEEMKKNSSGLASGLAVNQKHASKIAAAMLSTHHEVTRGTAAYRSMINEIKSSSASLDKAFLKTAGLIDSRTNELKDDLSLEEFSKLRTMLGETQSSLTEAFSKLGIEKLENFFNDPEALVSELSKRKNAAASEGPKSEEKFNEALVNMAVQLESAGHDLGLNLVKFENGVAQIDEERLKNLKSLEYSDLAKRLGQFSASVSKTSTNLDRIALESNTIIGKFNAFIKNIPQFPQNFIKNLSDSAVVAANFANALAATKDLYKQIVSFNIAQVPASFKEVNFASIRLGMSFDDTVKFLQENKRILAIYGPQQFKESMGDLKTTFSKFGYNFEQASKIVGPAIESGISSGLNIRSPEQLNNFIDSTMKSFQKISGIIDITADEYFKLNNELFNHEDIQGTLLGLDQSAAQERAKEITALRDHYLALGLSKEQAQALVKAQAAQQREKVTTRIKEAAKGMVLAQQVGMSPEESQRYFKLAMKGVRTPEEEKELQRLSTALGKGAEEMRVAQYGQSEAAGLAYDAFSEAVQQSGGLAEMQKTGKDIAVKERAGVPASKEEQARSEALAKGSETVSVFSNIVNSVNSFLENSFVKMITSSGLALLGLTANAFLAARALGAVSIASGSKSILGLLGSGFTGLFGKLGGIAASTGSIFGRMAAAGPAAVGAISSIGPVIGGMMASFATALTAAGTAVAGAFSALVAGAATLGSSLISALAALGPMIAKFAGPVAAAVTAVKGVFDWREISKKQEAGEISDKEATVKKAGVAGQVGGGVAGSLLGGKVGAAVGTLLAPFTAGLSVPIGAAAGAALGGWLGGSGGKTLAETIGNAVTTDEEAVAKPTPEKETVDKKITPAEPAIQKKEDSRVNASKMSGITGEQIANHKNYQKYYDEALMGRDSAQAKLSAKQVAMSRVKADIQSESAVAKPTPEKETVDKKITPAEPAIQKKEEPRINTSQISGEQILDHKNYQKYYDEALMGRDSAQAKLSAKQVAMSRVKADIQSESTGQKKEERAPQQTIVRQRLQQEKVGGYAIEGYEGGYDLRGKAEDVRLAAKLHKEFTELEKGNTGLKKSEEGLRAMQQKAEQFKSLADKINSTDYQEEVSKILDQNKNFKEVKTGQAFPLDVNAKTALPEKVTPKEQNARASGITGEQIANHKNYQKYYDEALMGRDSAQAILVAKKVAAAKVKADIVSETENKSNLPKNSLATPKEDSVSWWDKVKSIFQKPEEAKTAQQLNTGVDKGKQFEAQPATTPGIPVSPAPLSLAAVSQPSVTQQQQSINKKSDLTDEKNKESLSVEDLSAAEKLERIATGIFEAVSLLKTISQKETTVNSAEQSKPFSLSDMKQVTPGFSYLTGRST